MVFYEGRREILDTRVAPEPLRKIYLWNFEKCPVLLWFNIIPTLQIKLTFYLSKQITDTCHSQCKDFVTIKGKLNWSDGSQRIGVKLLQCYAMQQVSIDSSAYNIAARKIYSVKFASPQQAQVICNFNKNKENLIETNAPIMFQQDVQKPSTNN
jgi:hypothetical protein